MPSAIVTSTIQAGLLSAVSNILAQVLTAWRTQSPISINVVELLQFVVFSMLACPPNCLWQAWLEARFPAYPGQADHPTTTTPSDEKSRGHSTGTHTTDDALHRRNADGRSKGRPGQTGSKNDEAKKLSVKNTAIKFTLDQTIGASVNTVLFIAGIALLRGQDMRSISNDVHTKFWPMTLAGQKLWPAVSILSFTVIPLEQRMLFGSVAGLVWGVYLSLAAASTS
ncbi:hypothetical protein CB0940_00894 [Cercospora beticola]|uniref:PXMP2/4 family protein 3 n=1 Tax=Cercospora beticola TaxID=122368 RepID=A0A2G5I9K8_CERBT|nr:hypothetical protein CB0940_00894 [Cercospora beticola]PIB01194.1 hypothetical protein CB0940_00894 [Cercospora beticola]WPA96322.1 hypothetical protein RHO25_000928 [Cercospora beticola]